MSASSSRKPAWEDLRSKNLIPEVQFDCQLDVPVAFIHFKEQLQALR